jgi:gliding motility-associated-like protein
MKLFVYFFFFLLLASFSIEAQSLSPRTYPGKIFVKIKDASDHIFPALELRSDQSLPESFQSDLQSLIKNFGIYKIEKAFSRLQSRSLQKVYVFSFNDTSATDELLNVLARISYIEFAERIPLYETFYTPDDLDTRQWNLSKINAVSAWDLSKGSPVVKIAIVDDAVRLTHEDLDGVKWVNPGEFAGNNIDDDGNGYIDDINGYDVADSDNNPNPPFYATNSDFTHGTHCAGIAVASTDNATGISSISFNCRVIAVKCKPDGTYGGSLPYAYEGVSYAISANADIISMSWGGYFYSNTYQLLFDYARSLGIICVAAAGNSNTDIPMYPASYNNVISVAASMSTDQRASFSNYGTTIDVTAPGVNIWSTLAGSNSSYGYLSGTSMACPLVSGLCGLMLSADPSLSPDALENCLKSSCDPIDNLNPGYGGMLGAGRINAYKALTCLQKTPIADFTSDKTNICPGQTINFTDLSSGMISGSSWQWTFPGGIPASSTLKNSSVVYSTAGTYAVTLSVTNPFGNNALTKTAYIIVAAPAAILSGSATIPAGGTAFLRVDFTGASPWAFSYSNGIITTPVSNVVSNPYYFPVSPAVTTTYSLISMSSALCAGSVSGTGEITIGVSNPIGCGNINTFEKYVGGTNADEPVTLVEASDGGILSLSNTKSFTSGLYDILLVKTDELGTIEWSRHYGGSADDYGMGIIRTSGGGYLISGYTYSYGLGDREGYLIKIDDNGIVQWSKTYGSTRGDWFGSVIQTTDGGFIVVGATHQFDVNYMDIYLVKTDASGTIQWTKTYGGILNDWCYNVVQTSDGGYFLTGVSSSFRLAGSFGSTHDIFVLKINSAGSITWTRNFGTVNNDGGIAGIQTADGGYMVLAETDGAGAGSKDFFVTKLTSAGLISWGRTYGGSLVERVSGIQTLPDNSILLTGYTRSFGSSSLNQPMFVNISDNGNLNWARMINHGTATSIQMSKVTSDGGFIIVAASTPSPGIGSTDIYLAKTNSCLDFCTPYTPVSPSVSSLIPGIETPSVTINTHSPQASAVISNQAAVVTALEICTIQCAVNADFEASDSTICVNDTVSFVNKSTNASAYKWFIEDSLFSQSQDSKYVFVNPGVYHIYLNAKNSISCEDVDTLLITVYGLPIVKAFNDTIICSNTSVQLNATGGIQYIWKPSATLSCSNCSNPVASPLVPLEYIVTGIDVNGCNASDTAFVNPKCCINGLPGPVSDFEISDTLLCMGDTLHITNSSYTSLTAAFEWTFGSGAQPPSSSLKDPPSVTYSSPGIKTIRLIADDVCGRDTIIKIVNVFLPPVSDYEDLCTFGDTLTVPLSPVSGYLYQWSSSYGLSDSLIANPEISIKDTLMQYVVRITDENTGCSVTDTVIISGMDMAVDAGKDTMIVLGQSVIMNGCCGPDYQWYPPDFLSDPLIRNPAAAPERDITYFLSVSKDFCTVTDSVIIRVKQEILIPNLITLNSDGLNDYFKIKGLCKNSPLEIYNRWGSLVFKTDDYQNDWNGMSEPSQVYYYVFTESCTGQCYRGWLHVLK